MSLTPADLQRTLGLTPDGIIGPKTRAAIEAWFGAGTDLLAEHPVPPPGPQKTSARGIADLIHSEGLKTHAYRDSVGVWTIGVGHTANAGPPMVKPGMIITEAEARDILARDLAKFEARVRAALGAVSQNVFDGAVSFDFNTGQIDTASWVGAYRGGDMADARRRFMLYDKPPEIIGRRKREAALIFDGHYLEP